MSLIWSEYNSFVLAVKALNEVNQDLQCEKRKHSFWEDPVGDMLDYHRQSRPWCNQIIAIAHNAKVCNLHFILNRAILLEWRPELIMSGQKILCMSFEHMKFIDSICFLPFPLRKLSGAFRLTSSKSWNPHYFKKWKTWIMLGRFQNPSDYGVEEMSAGERTEFLAWYEEQKSLAFNNRQVLELYCQDDVTVLRQACRVFKGDFMRVGNIDVFQESVTIASRAIRCCGNCF
jgi:hypothetical protein